MLNVNLTKDLMKNLNDFIYDLEDAYKRYLLGEITLKEYEKCKDWFRACTIDGIVDSINGVDEFDR